MAVGVAEKGAAVERPGWRSRPCCVKCSVKYPACQGRAATVRTSSSGMEALCL